MGLITLPYPFSSPPFSLLQSPTPFHVRYGSGTVNGFFAKDSLEMAGYKASNQIFAQVVDASGLGRAYQVGKFDGLVGMGFKELSEGNVETPMGNLLAQGAINSGVFVFYLGLDSPGMITIGKPHASSAWMMKSPSHVHRSLNPTGYVLTDCSCPPWM